MMSPPQQATPPVVRVYRNLRTGTLSMQCKSRSGWRVFLHPVEVDLQDCAFVVRKAGRLRVLKHKRKNVHAWVEGTLVGYRLFGWEPTIPEFLYYARYNPYKNTTWVDHSGRPIQYAAGVRISCLRATVTYY